MEHAKHFEIDTMRLEAIPENKKRQHILSEYSLRRWIKGKLDCEQSYVSPQITRVKRRLNHRNYKSEQGGIGERELATSSTARNLASVTELRRGKRLLAV